jgi:4-amino-4-deoxychorismate lyase
MYPLVESIKVFHSRLCNIPFHNERLNNARRILFQATDTWNLEDIIELSALDPATVYKCRFTYGEKVGSVDFTPYTPKQTKYLKLVEVSDFDYSLKYADRNFLEELRNKNIDKADTDILIVKEGFITDTSYSNIVFSDGVKWYTPSTPLLKGTKRAYYLANKVILEREIKVSDLSKYLKARIINAMVDLEDAIEISVGNIYA